MPPRDDCTLLRDMIEAARAAIIAVEGRQFIAPKEDPYGRWAW